jgi:site-specific recombinase XerD
MRDDGTMKLERAVGDFVTQLHVERGLSPNTARSYRTDLDTLVSFAESRGMQSVETSTSSYCGTGCGRQPRKVWRNPRSRGAPLQ